MKKILLSVAILIFSIAAYSQHLSINAFGGYTFRDKINFGMPTRILMAAACGARLSKASTPRDQDWKSFTSIRVHRHLQPIYVPPKTINSNTVVSYLLLNFEQYYMNNPKIQPYGAIGFGASFYSSDYNGSTSATKFAWDLKAGVKFKASDAIGIKIGAQLLGSAQATGTYWYYGYPYTSYATILQFGFTGGLVFDFGGH